MGVFDVDAEAELLEDTALGLDHLVLQVDVRLIEDQRRDRPAITRAPARSL